MPNDFREHIDEPTFSKVLQACRKRGVWVTVRVRDKVSAPCRVEMSRNTARIEFDFINIGSTLSKEMQARYVKKHTDYRSKYLMQMKPKQTGISGNFSDNVIHFQVLEEHASDWFDDVYQELQNPANFTPRPSISDLFKERRSESASKLRQKPSIPKGPPAESEETVKLRRELQVLEPANRPKTPETLKAIQRVLKTYERPSSITKYVKKTRGSNCQLCGIEGFKMRNGKRYSEVHHLFHLSKNPPPMCLGPEYLVALCATCHRRMHYANISDPIREEQGWRVTIDDDEVVFKV